MGNKKRRFVYIIRLQEILIMFGLLLTAVATGLGMYGAYRETQQAQQQAEYQQEMAEYNARVRQQQIESEAEATAQEQLEIRRRGQQAIGQQESLLAASGVSLTEGSPMELLAQTSADIERDVELAEYEGQLRQSELKTAKTQSEMQAEQAGYQAEQLETAKLVSPLTTGVSSIMGSKRTRGLLS